MPYWSVGEDDVNAPCLMYPVCNSPLSDDECLNLLYPPTHIHPPIFRASCKGCRWRVPTLLRTAARWHTGGRWWRSPGCGCAAPWRWCGCSHKWRPRCSTPPIQHPPPLSWWERPLRRPPAAGRQPQALLLIGPAALQKEKRVTHEEVQWGGSCVWENSASKRATTATNLQPQTNCVIHLEVCKQRNKLWGE